eukprot:Rhum_TRINITY_DN12475_c0_g1::Rhum_TRINITY_DN12475_c0_g1_i1::g.51913::m.51913
MLLLPCGSASLHSMALRFVILGEPGPTSTYADPRRLAVLLWSGGREEGPPPPPPASDGVPVKNSPSDAKADFFRFRGVFGRGSAAGLMASIGMVTRTLCSRKPAENSCPESSLSSSGRVAGRARRGLKPRCSPLVRGLKRWALLELSGVRGRDESLLALQTPASAARFSPLKPPRALWKPRESGRRRGLPRGEMVKLCSLATRRPSSRLSLSAAPSLSFRDCESSRQSFAALRRSSAFEAGYIKRPSGTSLYTTTKLRVCSLTFFRKDSICSAERAATCRRIASPGLWKVDVGRVMPGGSVGMLTVSCRMGRR